MLEGILDFFVKHLHQVDSSGDALNVANSLSTSDFGLEGFPHSLQIIPLGTGLSGGH